MVVEVPAIHQVQDETELVRGVEGIGHTDDEGAVMASGNQAQHYPLIQCQSLPLLHLYSLFVQTLKQK